MNGQNALDYYLDKITQANEALWDVYGVTIPGTEELDLSDVDTALEKATDAVSDALEALSVLDRSTEVRDEDKDND